jgi:hypothetical protein
MCLDLGMITVIIGLMASNEAATEGVFDERAKSCSVVFMWRGFGCCA